MPGRSRWRLVAGSALNASDVGVFPQGSMHRSRLAFFSSSGAVARKKPAAGPDIARKTICRSVEVQGLKGAQTDLMPPRRSTHGPTAWRIASYRRPLRSSP